MWLQLLRGLTIRTVCHGVRYLGYRWLLLLWIEQLLVQLVGARHFLDQVGILGRLWRVRGVHGNVVRVDGVVDVGDVLWPLR